MTNFVILILKDIINKLLILTQAVRISFSNNYPIVF